MHHAPRLVRLQTASRSMQVACQIPAVLKNCAATVYSLHLMPNGRGTHGDHACCRC